MTGKTYVKRNVTGGRVIEEIPQETPQTAISGRDRLGGIYLTPITNDPGSKGIKAAIDTKEHTVTVLRS